MTKRTITTKLVGKEELFRIIALGEATKLPVLFIGPPGVAKTQAILDYASSYYAKDATALTDKTFIIELDEGTKSTEIKGRPDMKELLENKKYIIDAPIASAEFVLINEIDKGSSAIRNTMLSIMRERILFFGSEKRKCEWKVFAGSCNIMSSEVEDLPLWDRFVIKSTVSRLPVTDIPKMWSGTDTVYEINIPSEEEIEKQQLNSHKIGVFIRHIYPDLTDRTISQIPLMISAAMTIWDASETEAITKVCEILVPAKLASLVSLIEDKRVTALKNKIKSLASMTDVSHLAKTMADIQKELRTLVDSGADAKDVSDCAEMLKKEVDQIPILSATKSGILTNTDSDPVVKKAPEPQPINQI